MTMWIYIYEVKKYLILENMAIAIDTLLLLLIKKYISFQKNEIKTS